MLARFHPRVRRGRLGEREAAVDDRLQPAALDVRPTVFGNLVGDHRLERDRARTKRRSGEDEAPAA